MPSVCLRRLRGAGFYGGKPHTVAQAAVRVGFARGLECADSLLVFDTGTRSSACQSVTEKWKQSSLRLDVCSASSHLLCHNITSLLRHLVTTSVSALLRNHTNIISSGKMNICNSCDGKWDAVLPTDKNGESSVTLFIPGRVIASRGKPKRNNTGKIIEVNFNAGM